MDFNLEPESEVKIIEEVPSIENLSETDSGTQSHPLSQPAGSVLRVPVNNVINSKKFAQEFHQSVLLETQKKQANKPVSYSLEKGEL